MSDIITYPEDGILYNADDASGYLATRISGVYSAEEDFSVTPSGGLDVLIGAGHAWVRPSRWLGRSIVMQQPTTLTMPEADAVLPRTDRIVLRYDASARQTDLQVLTGTPASTPAAPELSRTAFLYDLCIAEVSRPAGSTVITAANIIDTRADEAVCGLMRDGVTGIPTEELLAKWNAVQAQQQAKGEQCLADMQAKADKIIRNYSGGYMGQYELILQPAGWQTATGSTGYGYLYDAPLSDAKSDHYPQSMPAIGSQDAAEDCRMAQICETFDGFIRFWAKSVPTAALVMEVTLFGSSGTSSGGTGYDIATDTEVKDMLDRVYSN